MPLFQNAVFHVSAHHLRELPPASGLEVAFAGRSNAGKSSALNTLANHNRLAFVSKQPGRTQLINFFSLGNERYLVDLPGYGYAKVPEAMRKHWQITLSRYLMERTSLCGLALVMDARHPLTPLDRQMLDWFCPSGQPVHVLLTKADKISRSQGALTLGNVKKELAEHWGHHRTSAQHNPHTVQLFSSLRKQGVEEAEAVIGSWLFEQPNATPADKPSPLAE